MNMDSFFTTAIISIHYCSNKNKKIFYVLWTRVARGQKWRKILLDFAD